MHETPHQVLPNAGFIAVPCTIQAHCNHLQKLQVSFRTLPNATCHMVSAALKADKIGKTLYTWATVRNPVIENVFA